MDKFKGNTSTSSSSRINNTEISNMMTAFSFSSSLYVSEIRSLHHYHHHYRHHIIKQNFCFCILYTHSIMIAFSLDHCVIKSIHKVFLMGFLLPLPLAYTAVHTIKVYNDVSVLHSPLNLLLMAFYR